MGRPGLAKHPKFRRLCYAAKIPTPHARGYLECLWETAYETGEAEIGDAVDIELAAQWEGEPGQLHAALLSAGGEGRAGFIEECPDRPGRYRIHDLFDHAPAYVNARKGKEEERRKPRFCESCGTEYRSTESHSRFCSDSCRVASYREKHRNEGVTDGNEGVRNSNERVTECNEPPAPAPAPAPAPHIQKDKHAAHVSAEAARRPSPEIVAEDVELWIPCIAKKDTDREQWPLMRDQVREWTKTFPAVDVPQQCRAALEWIKANPTNRKTYSGVPRFLVSWLTRQQNSARPNASSRSDARAAERAASLVNGIRDRENNGKHTESPVVDPETTIALIRNRIRDQFRLARSDSKTAETKLTRARQHNPDRFQQTKLELLEHEIGATSEGMDAFHVWDRLDHETRVAFLWTKRTDDPQAFAEALGLTLHELEQIEAGQFQEAAA